MKRYEKHSQEEAEPGGNSDVEKVRKEKIRDGESQKKEDAGARKVGKPQNTAFVQWFVALEGRRVASQKRRVRSQLAKWKMKSCTPLWREARFEVKRCKTRGVRTAFGNWDVEKVHIIVARNTFVHAIVARSTFSK